MSGRQLEVQWPLHSLPDWATLEALCIDQDGPELRRLWAESQLGVLQRGDPLPTRMPTTLHGVQLGEGLRLIGLEGEVMAELGLLMHGFYPNGITAPLGYCNGAQAYLPTSRMLEEGGYEAESYWEYGHPAPLVRGMETILMEALQDLRGRGIR